MRMLLTATYEGLGLRGLGFGSGSVFWVETSIVVHAHLCLGGKGPTPGPGVAYMTTKTPVMKMDQRTEMTVSHVRKSAATPRSTRMVKVRISPSPAKVHTPIRMRSEVTPVRSWCPRRMRAGARTRKASTLRR